jgi:hypothetical protein
MYMRFFLVIFFIAPAFLIPAAVVAGIWRVLSKLFFPKQVIHEQALPAANPE